jgi:hypothetical protein
MRGRKETLKANKSALIPQITFQEALRLGKNNGKSIRRKQWKTKKYLAVATWS